MSLPEECKKAHAEYLAYEAEKQRRLNAGEYLRCAALGEQAYTLCVKVWFRNSAGDEIIRYMHVNTYHAFPLLESVSPEQYASVGRVECEPFTSTPEL